jgi:hypothetical protein
MELGRHSQLGPDRVALAPTATSIPFETSKRENPQMTGASGTNAAEASNEDPRVANRLDPAVVFIIDALLDDETDGLQDPPLTPATARVVEEIGTDLGSRPTLRPADVGRGASGIGFALQVLEAIDTYGGALALSGSAALGVRRCYRRLRKSAGRAPLISLGAAQFLAAADLVDRIGQEEIRLYGSGGACSQSPDRSFTGGDAFYVILVASRRMHIYVVSAFGEAQYIGDAPEVPNYMEAQPPPFDQDEPV